MMTPRNQLDYLDFFGFDEPPFRLSPDPDFFFHTRPHQAAKEVLAYGIRRGDGFMVLTGTAGTGKSLLLRILIQEVPAGKKTAVVVTPALSPQSLLRMVLDELEAPVDHSQQDLGLLIKEFESALLSLARQGCELLLIIDEAQNLPLETLEQLRLLSNIETDSRKLVQILLAGQPELKELLGSPRLFQLSQRISITEELRPLTRKETGQYINFRLSRAGRTDITLTRSALGRIHARTSGIPRLVNRIMDRVLLIAASEGTQTITGKHVAQADRTLPHFSRSRGCAGRLMARPAIWVTTALVVLCLGLYKFYPFSGTMVRTMTATLSRQLQGPSTSELPLQKQKTEQAVNPVDRVRVAVDKALIRQAPGTGHPRIATAMRGQEFQLIDEQNGWSAIRIFDPAGHQTSGWIKSELLTRAQEPSVTPAPIRTPVGNRDKQTLTATEKPTSRAN
ncbi:AAA family ATPase [Desulfolithobacter sp.]